MKVRKINEKTGKTRVIGATCRYCLETYTANNAEDWCLAMISAHLQKCKDAPEGAIRRGTA